MGAAPYSASLDSPVGRLWLSGSDAGISGIRFIRENPHTRCEDFFRPAVEQLQAYFAGELRDFDLDLDLSGTEFQRSVWKRLSEIDYGEIDHYGAIAEGLGRRRAARAVGAACGANRIAIVIPCHRVLGSSGLTGYAGGLAAKQYLLRLENEHC
ncbi:MAG: methylated-DNA--[protein]-cysteine S-methyltransferase [Gammaproteobacteria bacterium AqS3]|nr:methylated-DNA--[protein]-cysteine S-methyltransferase [Gammaproteobacteria bacterium AqS3]